VTTAPNAGTTGESAARFGACVVGICGTGMTFDRGAYCELTALREVEMAAHSKVLKGRPLVAEKSEFACSHGFARPACLEPFGGDQADLVPWPGGQVPRPGGRVGELVVADGSTGL
jgi:hypothetical protein